MRISLVIPTLNEQDSLEILTKKLTRVDEQLKIQSHTLELIFVDDGSTDNTPHAIQHFATQTTIPVQLVQRKERGLATAVLRGFQEAHGDILGVIDADLSHPPEKIPELVQQLETADLVIGSRHAHGGSVEEWPWHRKLFSNSATILAKPLTKKVHDPMSGFFFLKRNTIKGKKLNPCGYKILLEILVKGTATTIAEVPYTFCNRKVGKSKLNWKITLAYFWHVLKLYAWKMWH